jgi:hypothetical protein
MPRHGAQECRPFESNWTGRASPQPATPGARPDVCYPAQRIVGCGSCGSLLPQRPQCSTPLQGHCRSCGALYGNPSASKIPASSRIPPTRSLAAATTTGQHEVHNGYMGMWREPGGNADQTNHVPGRADFPCRDLTSDNAPSARAQHVSLAGHLLTLWRRTSPLNTVPAPVVHTTHSTVTVKLCRTFTHSPGSTARGSSAGSRAALRAGSGNAGTGRSRSSRAPRAAARASSRTAGRSASGGRETCGRRRRGSAACSRTAAASRAGRGRQKKGPTCEGISTGPNQMVRPHSRAHRTLRCTATDVRQPGQLARVLRSQQNSLRDTPGLLPRATLAMDGWAGRPYHPQLRSIREPTRLICSWPFPYCETLICCSCPLRGLPATRAAPAGSCPSG